MKEVCRTSDNNIMYKFFPIKKLLDSFDSKAYVLTFNIWWLYPLHTCVELSPQVASWSWREKHFILCVKHSIILKETIFQAILKLHKWEITYSAERSFSFRPFKLSNNFTSLGYLCFKYFWVEKLYVYFTQVFKGVCCKRKEKEIVSF